MKIVYWKLNGEQYHSDTVTPETADGIAANLALNEFVTDIQIKDE